LALLCNKIITIFGNKAKNSVANWKIRVMFEYALAAVARFKTSLVSADEIGGLEHVIRVTYGVSSLAVQDQKLNDSRPGLEMPIECYANFPEKFEYKLD
jgi:hypothetical protein